MTAFEQLEAWRLADPKHRRYVVDAAPPAKGCDDTARVMLSESRTGRLLYAYDADEPPGKSGCYSRATVWAGKGVGVARVVEAALERWRELYPEGGAT